MIEVSYPNSQPNNQLFGHLKPELLNQKPQKLSTFTTKEQLYDFPIIVIHIKPEGNNERKIKEELKKEKTFHMK